MITSFRHKGLKALHEGTSAKVMQHHVPKLLRVLSALDEAVRPEQMDLAGFRFHRLRGVLKRHYAVSISANWRVTFRFERENAVDVDYLDYH